MPEAPTPRADGTRRPSRRTPVRVLLVGLVVAMAIGALLLVRADLGSSPEGTSTSTPAPAPTTPPPYPEPPMSRTDTDSLLVPEEARFAQGTFWARSGESYLVTFTLEGTKPEESGGRSMYLGVTFSCSPKNGGPGITVGGTQNILTGETAQYRNQGLITVPEDGAIDCSISTSAPYDDVASAGATVPISGAWEVEEVSGAAAFASTDGLPTSVAAGTDSVVLAEDVPFEEAADGEVRAMTSLHLTTCTGVNGSREDGRLWCDEADLDEAGSTVTTSLTAQLVDPGGEVCGDLGAVSTAPDLIDMYRHHRLLSLGLAEEMPVEPCGTIVRLAVTVHNDGPAALVVHRSNSSMVIVE